MASGSKAKVKVRDTQPRQDSGTKTNGGKVGGGRPRAGVSPSKGSSRRYGPINNISYPLNVDSDKMQGHYIMFLINTPEGAKLHAGKKTARKIDPTSTTHKQGPTVHRGVGQEKSRRSLQAIRPASKRISANICLYMPPQITNSGGANYQDTEIEVGAEAAIQGGSAFFGDRAVGKSLWDSVATGLSAAANELSGAAANFATGKLLANVPGMGGINELRQIATGVANSGRMELMFQRINRRSFSYTFAFVPKNSEESKVVQEIIFMFRASMHPEYGSGASLLKAIATQGERAINAGVGNPKTKTKKPSEAVTKFNKAAENIAGGAMSGRNLLIPDTFDIQYMYKNAVNNYLHKISTCYLKNCSVNYGGDRFTAYDIQPGIFGEGAPPQNITMSLEFDEMEVLTRESIYEGF